VGEQRADYRCARSRGAVGLIKRQRNQIARAENVRRRRIAAFRGSNQGGIECVCYDASARLAPRLG